MKLILFCGPSGSGKTTIVQHLLKTNERLCFSISATTRPMREIETNGVDYYFISPDEFRLKIMRDEFIEWEQVYQERYYGTLKSEVERIFKQGKFALFDVDVEGGLKIKSVYEDNVLAVFVKPPSVEVLHQRLTARASETAESLKTRLDKAELELTYSSKFDQIIINDDLQTAFARAEKLVNDFIRETKN